MTKTISTAATAHVKIIVMNDAEAYYLTLAREVVKILQRYNS